MMDCKKCKDCIYYRCYYHGEAKFSHECLWTLRDPHDVDEGDCHKVIDQMGKSVDSFRQSFYNHMQKGA